MPATMSERLNALVDGELSKEERAELLGLIEQDPKLKAELCDIHRLKDLVGFAYPLKAKDQAIKQQPWLRVDNIAASLLLVLGIGFMSGYVSSSLLSSDSVDSTLLQAQALPQINEPQNKVIIYLGSSEKKKFEETLNKAEALLKKYRATDTAVYVVTSAGGIDLLRANNSGIQQRIKKMRGLYATNLHFVACNNQIYQLHQKGQDVNLVDEVEVAPSAVQFVVNHLKKGWRYIAI